MTIFRISIGNVERYIRGNSHANARVRAFKVWGFRNVSVSIAARQMCPDIGAKGYERACNAMETFAGTSAALRAMQSHKGRDCRAMYNPTHAAQCRTENKARELLARLGLAA